jgi:hypothetical protein
MSTIFDDYLKEQLRDPEFRKEYDALQPERSDIQAIIDTKHKSG